MDLKLEALDKTRRRIGHIAKLAELAKEHLRESRFEDGFSSGVTRFHTLRPHKGSA